MHSNAGYRINAIGYTPKEYNISGIKLPGNKDRKADKKDITPEQRMINQFKEENSPENKRVSEIYAKFRAGKELTAEELDYIAKHSPELYKEIREVMMERKALEARMKAAKTKMEVHAIVTNEVMTIKKTAGTGEQAKNDAMKTMARANQMTDAEIKFMASAEYREKEDEKTQAEDRRAALEEYMEQLDKLKEQIEEQADKTDKLAEVLFENIEDSIDNSADDDNEEGKAAGITEGVFGKKYNEEHNAADTEAEVRHTGGIKKAEAGHSSAHSIKSSADNVTAEDISEDAERAKRNRRRRRVSTGSQAMPMTRMDIKIVTKADLQRSLGIFGGSGNNANTGRVGK